MINRIFWVVSIIPFISLLILAIPFGIVNVMRGKAFCIYDNELAIMTDKWNDNIVKAIKNE